MAPQQQYCRSMSNFRTITQFQTKISWLCDLWRYLTMKCLHGYRNGPRYHVMIHQRGAHYDVCLSLLSVHAFMNPHKATDLPHKSLNATDISHNILFCNRNVHTCAHFCYKTVHCEIRECGICATGLLS